MKFKSIAFSVLVLMLSGCASAPLKSEQPVPVQDKPLHTVIEYRDMLNKDPDSIEYKTRLKQAELEAADYYYEKGMAYYTRGQVEDALTEFQKGLTAMPDNGKLRQAITVSVARKEADMTYLEAESLKEAGRLTDAAGLYQRALQLYPEHRQSRLRLKELERSRKSIVASDKWAMDSAATVNLNFRGTDLRTAFEFLAKSFDVNVIFDEGIKGVPVNMFAKGVTFKQGISLLTATTKTFYKRIGPNTIIIAPDKKDKRGQYEDHITRVFPLKSISAKEMKSILKGVLSINKVTVNEELNLLIVRDTADVLSLAEKIIVNSDRKPSEMILDVEILEVSRTKADKLGLDLGTYEVSVGVPSATLIPLTGSIPNNISNAANLSIPSATLRFLKQEIDAKTLANPRIRVVNRETASIHIGDRVPLQASRIIDATGQVRTTFDYRDIGIRLKLTPTINLDNSIAVKLELEVSTLGENLGTPNEPAYKIGTRNANSVMILRDGETAILGGLIRDEDRTTESKLPFLGSVPFLGKLFTSSDKSGVKTDVLLTISPRVIRGHDLAAKSEREFYSGTERNYLDRAVFAYGNKRLIEKSEAESISPELFVPPAYTKEETILPMPESTEKPEAKPADEGENGASQDKGDAEVNVGVNSAPTVEPVRAASN